jgi:hypothetical protein
MDYLLSVVLAACVIRFWATFFILGCIGDGMRARRRKDWTSYYCYWVSALIGVVPIVNTAIGLW